MAALGEVAARRDGTRRVVDVPRAKGRATGHARARPPWLARTDDAAFPRREQYTRLGWIAQGAGEAGTREAARAAVNVASCTCGYVVEKCVFAVDNLWRECGKHRSTLERCG